MWMLPQKTYANEEVGQLYALSAVMMDGESGRILFEKEGEEPRANASTTKILTCIIALENSMLDETVVVSANATTQPKVHLGMQEGEGYVLEDLLYSLMLESHNDSAVAIAEHVGGSVTNFASLMNHKAATIGCEDSYFITPNGLDASDEQGFHHTTAEDLARILMYCMNQSPKADEFLRITQTKNHTFHNEDGLRSFSVNNHNSLLDMTSEAVTGKTGFTNDAGYCYVGAIESEGRTFIVALLGAGWPYNKNYKWEDCMELFGYGKTNYKNYELRTVSGDDQWKQITYVNGKNLENRDETLLKVETGETINLLKRKDEKVEILLEYPGVIKAPVEEDTLVGTARYLVDGEIWKVDGIYTTENIEETDMWFELYKRLFTLFHKESK